MPVEIDISKVPAEKRNDPKFLELLAQMQAALANPKWQAAFCIHEAGHKIYLSRFGITQFTFIGPYIVYDAARDDFDGYPLAVKAEPVPLTAEGFDFEGWLVRVAQAKAAGGVFARRLTNAPDQGDAEDKDEFKRACALLREKMPKLQIDEEGIWKHAQEEISKELRSPEFRRNAWTQANEIKIQIFG
jgi:hypothetical protein